VFYENLNKAILHEYRSRLPNLESGYRKNSQRWFSHCEKILEETIQDDEFWLNYWLSCSWLKEPTEADAQEVKTLNDDDIIHACVCLATSLKGILFEDYENSAMANNLHELWKLAEKESNKRGFGVYFDPYETELSRKKKGVIINEAKLWEKARSEGSICPHCQSKNVRSYNKQEWKCHDCGKRFRKH
jgi:hypothetical protein